MRTIPTNLYNEIQEGNICNIMKITLLDGTIHGYTDLDQSITVEGVTYVPAPGLQKVKMSVTSNAEVSNQELSTAWVDAPESDLIGGKFDSAAIEVAWASWKHPEYGGFPVFIGKLGEITWNDSGFRADIFSAMKDLEKTFGTTFTGNCRHTLYSQGAPGLIGYCGINASSHVQSGSVSAVIKNRWKFQISITQPDNYFAYGSLQFTSGANSGLIYQVKKQEGNQIELMLPTSFLVAPGDTFTIHAGCDKTLATCKAKFNNVANFGGFPHIQSGVSFS